MNSCLILAAGNGSRMKLKCPKVLARVLNVPMLSWVLDSVIDCGINNQCVVTGYGSAKVKKFLKSNNYNCETVFQAERKGTAHAVMVAHDFLKKNISGDVLILGGDSPFIDSDTIMLAYKNHKKNKNAATIVSANFENPFGYGRIVRNKSGNVCSIVEEREADDAQRKITEINSGAYWFNVKNLLQTIGCINASSLSGELYLTSIISIFIKNGLKVDACCASDYTVALGANTPEQLETLNIIAKSKVFKGLIARGINIPCCDNVFISKNAEIGEGTTILSNVTINSCTKIGKNCTIGPGTVLSGENIPDNTNLIFYNSNNNFNNIKSKEVKYAF